jgi:hypothetical protein
MKMRKDSRSLQLGVLTRVEASRIFNVVTLHGNSKIFTTRTVHEATRTARDTIHFHGTRLFDTVVVTIFSVDDRFGPSHHVVIIFKIRQIVALRVKDDTIGKLIADAAILQAIETGCVGAC